MVKSDNNSKFLFKMVVLVIVVIINIIALIGVFITVGNTINNLREELKTGIIQKDTSQTQENTSYMQSDNETPQNEEEEDFGDDFEINIDTSSIIKAIMQDKKALKSVILMAIALVLLSIAVVVFKKLG